jgi:uncharacterized membrane protein YidH (DUF202 family)
MQKPNMEGTMGAAKIIGILLIIGGIAAATTGGFSFTKETHEANIGPVELSVKDKERVNIPLWAGIGAVVVGVVLLAVPAKRA